MLVCRWLLEPLILLVSLLKFVQISRGSYRSFSSWGSLFYEFAMCRVHKPGVPHGPASQQRIGPADDVANDAQLLGRPKKPNDRPGAIQSSTGRPDQRGTALASDSGPPLQPEGLAEEERRSLPSLPTSARLSDRKAWPRRIDAHLRLRPASSTRRPSQRGTTLAL